jgi:prepilin-type N-terminal cleavage/methylation domain-containing protein
MKGISVRNQSGFTLLELLVVAALLGVVLGAIYSLYITHLRVAYTQDDVVELQQNLRIAMDAVSKDLRMAGTLVPTSVTPLQNGFGSYSSSLQLNTASPDRRFARVMHGSTIGTGFASYTTTVGDPLLSTGFNTGDTVRIIRPYDRSLPFGNVSSLYVSSASSTTGSVALKPTGGATMPAGTTLNVGDVIAKVNTPTVNAYPALSVGYNSVVYSLVAAGTGACPAGTGACLARQVNPPLPLPAPVANQIVASNLSRLNLHYIMDDGSETATPSGSESSIKAVRVTITGVTSKKTDPGWVPRTRQLSSMIMLRNHLRTN